MYLHNCVVYIWMKWMEHVSLSVDWSWTTTVVPVSEGWSRSSRLPASSLLGAVHYRSADPPVVSPPIGWPALLFPAGARLASFQSPEMWRNILKKAEDAVTLPHSQQSLDHYREADHVLHLSLWVIHAQDYTVTIVTPSMISYTKQCQRKCICYSLDTQMCAILS